MDANIIAGIVYWWLVGRKQSATANSGSNIPQNNQGGSTLPYLGDQTESSQIPDPVQIPHPVIPFGPSSTLPSGAAPTAPVITVRTLPPSVMPVPDAPLWQRKPWCNAAQRLAPGTGLIVPATVPGATLTQLYEGYQIRNQGGYQILLSNGNAPYRLPGGSMTYATPVAPPVWIILYDDAMCFGVSPVMNT